MQEAIGYFSNVGRWELPKTWDILIEKWEVWVCLCLVWQEGEGHWSTSELPADFSSHLSSQWASLGPPMF